MKLSAIARKNLMGSLAGVKDYLLRAFRSLTTEEAPVPGPGGALCPVEQAWHLADLEREGFGLSIERVRTKFLFSKTRV